MDKLQYLRNRIKGLTEKYYRMAEHRLSDGNGLASDIFFDVSEELEDVLEKVDDL
jgi:hypothetical protein